MDHVLRLQMLEADPLTAGEADTPTSSCSNGACSFANVDGIDGQ
ncbi:MAG: hypothetical protein AAGC76_08470 [Luteibacter sp.]|jgi:hypothetical protein|nr:MULTISPECIES: hypothetical protein [Rhodanobacteraceae]MDQ7995874.1 hypothetical protein [Luteibacter sp.]MDQ8049162.1 hypothetical protein [Luteibacter sp.]MDR6642331.1 hypothetical protein [Luteibacter sp. 1214]SDG19980.1 hypothetical protein SAMN04515659_2376 [Dyella sp. 333MFSha]SKB55719.1 hypothetical protein SAMN05660880_01603 [Luteibacter sp. 22Crub2.1]